MAPSETRDEAAYEEVKTLLPHREPFLFVDAVEADGDSFRGWRRFRDDDFFFKGHFPSYPVVPGVILIETMAQAGGAGLKKTGVLSSGLFFLASVDKVKFRRQVRPGDLFESRVETLRASNRAIKQSGKGYVNGELAVEAEWLCMIGEEPKS